MGCCVSPKRREVPDAIVQSEAALSIIAGKTPGSPERGQARELRVETRTVGRGRDRCDRRGASSRFQERELRHGQANVR